LNISKIEAGKMTIEVLNFDLVKTIESNLDIMAARAFRRAPRRFGAVSPQKSHPQKQNA
jgi:hypothetical protein